MELTIATILVAFAGVFLICFMKGAFGGGFSIVGIPLLSLVMDPVTAGGLLALRPEQFFAASSDLVGALRDMEEMVQRYPSVKVPVGILFGRGDEILSHQEHGVVMQSAIPGLTVSLVDGGHMLPLVAPELTAQWITQFAQRVRTLIPA